MVWGSSEVKRTLEALHCPFIVNLSLGVEGNLMKQDPCVAVSGGGRTMFANDREMFPCCLESRVWVVVEEEEAFGVGGYFNNKKQH